MAFNLSLFRNFVFKKLVGMLFEHGYTEAQILKLKKYNSYDTRKS